MACAARARLPFDPNGGVRMLDVLYVVGTAVFFAVMVAFVVGCERIIGARDEDCTPGGLDETIEPAE